MKGRIAPNLYTALWILFYSLGLLNISFLSTPLQLFLIIWSLYFFVIVNTRGKLPPLLKILNVLMVLVLVYGILRFFIPQKLFSTPAMFIVSYTMSISPIYAYYYFFNKKIIDLEWLKNASVFFVLTGFVIYFRQYEKAMALQNGYAEGVVNNAGYVVAALIPMTIYFRKKLLKYATLLFIIFISLYSAKRGAILITGISSLLVYLYYGKGKIKSKVRTIVGLFVISIILIIYVEYYLLSDSFFSSRLDQTLEGESSNRDVIYNMFWNFIINEDSIPRWLFGYGADGTLLLFNVFAHNDWLELAIDMGLVGAVSYLIYWIVFLKTILFAKQNKQKEIVLVLQLLFILFFMRSLFSMSLNRMYFFSDALMGYVLAILYQKNNNSHYTSVS